MVNHKQITVEECLGKRGSILPLQSPIWYDNYKVKTQMKGS